VVALALLAAVVLPAAGLVYHIRFDERDLPDIQPFLRFELPEIGQVIDIHGTVLITLAVEYRQSVAYHQVPAIVRQAILSAEDKNFFSHSGVDYTTLPRVAWKTASRSVSAGWGSGGSFKLRLPQGGSTITQQLVRGYFLGDRSRGEDNVVQFHRGILSTLLSTTLGVPNANKLLRKMEELRLALWLERDLTRRYGSKQRAKEEIFRRYASYIYLGNGRYGFAAASEYYFGRALSSYTHADAGLAALLAGISKSPRDYAPVDGAASPIRRRNEILTLMVGNGWISSDRAQKSQAEPIRIVPISPIKTLAPAAIAMVVDELDQHGAEEFALADLFQGRIAVQSTVDARVQAIAQDALEAGLAVYERRHPGATGTIQGAVVVLRNSNAAILAVVGGRAIYQGRSARYTDFNRATDALRQPGSAWKPLVYLAAFRQGMRLESTVLDAPITVSGGVGGESKSISNYDGRFKGSISARQALAESRNAVAIRLAQDVGMGRVIAIAQTMGIQSPVNQYISTALGASEVRLVELANVYRAMASESRAQPHIVRQVTDATGMVLYTAAGSAQSFQSEAMRQVQEGLRGVIRLPGGTAHGLSGGSFPIPVMGKTGTTSANRDALFIGSTYGPAGITVAVRIGFDDNRSLGSGETGGRTALPVFKDLMLRVYAARLVGDVPKFPWEIEDGIDGYLTGRMSAVQVYADTAGGRTGG